MFSNDIGILTPLAINNSLKRTGNISCLGCDTFGFILQTFKTFFEIYESNELWISFLEIFQYKYD